MAFQRNEENPLEADLVIVDEASMLDLLLTNHLLKAISPGAHLLLVGDVDQLPSVGAGSVLRDVIAAIEEMARQLRASARVVRLDTIFRQPEGSYIITNAHRINQGQMPAFDNRNATDFFLFKEEDADAAAQSDRRAGEERIPRRFGLTPDEIQVLSPMHRGDAGVTALEPAAAGGALPAAPRPARAADGRAHLSPGRPRDADSQQLRQRGVQRRHGSHHRRQPRGADGRRCGWMSGR